MKLRSMEKLGAGARETTEGQNRALVEQQRISADKSASERLFEDVRSAELPPDAKPEQYMREYGNELKEHEKEADEKNAVIDEKRREIRKELSEHFATTNKLLETLRKRRETNAGDRHFEKIKGEQNRKIQEINRIRAEMDERDRDFESMLAIARPYFRNAENLSAARPYYRIGKDEFEGKRADLEKLNDFTGHTERHIREVFEKMKDMQCTLDEIMDENGGIFDKRTLDAAVLFHDTGLDADLTQKWKPWFVGAFRGDIHDRGGMKASSEPRDRHTITGAANILRHKDALKSMGVNADQAAFLIYLHSKKGFDESTGKKSGVRDLSQKSFEDTIKDAADKFEKDCVGRDIKWDMSWLKDENGEWDPEAMKKAAMSASLLRIADAGRDGNRLYAQNGAEYVFENEKNLKEVDYKSYDDLKNNMAKEVEDIRISYDDGREVTNLESKAIVYGEHNIGSMNLIADENGDLTYHFVVRDSEKALGCTTYAIWERLAEINNSAFHGMSGRIVITCENGNAAGLMQCLRETSDGKAYKLPSGWSLTDKL